MKFNFVYTGIRVRDLDRSLAFYRDVLGLKDLGRLEIEKTGGVVASVANDEEGHPLELNWYPEDSSMADPYKTGEELDHLAFYVEDLDAAMRYLEERGHPMVLGPIESKNSTWAYVQDPDGIYVEIVASKRHE
ncbi:MAG: VOC family protein [Thermoplasmata archaeon]